MNIISGVEEGLLLFLFGNFVFIHYMKVNNGNNHFQNCESQVNRQKKNELFFIQGMKIIMYILRERVLISTSSHVCIEYILPDLLCIYDAQIAWYLHLRKRNIQTSQKFVHKQCGEKNNVEMMRMNKIAFFVSATLLMPHGKLFHFQPLISPSFTSMAI